MAILRNLRIAMAFAFANVENCAHSALFLESARGEMLYSTHCVACHTVQVHWRDKHNVTDWESLKHRVDEWQRSIGLGWNSDDVAGVSAYLDETFYHFRSVKEKEVALKKYRQ